jgi:hypothetical protein
MHGLQQKTHSNATDPETGIPALIKQRRDINTNKDWNYQFKSEKTAE